MSAVRGSRLSQVLLLTSGGILYFVGKAYNYQGPSFQPAQFLGGQVEGQRSEAAFEAG